MPPDDDFRERLAERNRAEQQRAPMPFWWFGQRDPVARFTLYLGLFTFVLVIVGILQWLSIHGQLVEMQSDTAGRPWMGIGLHVDDIEANKDANATIGFVNSGRRPAKVTLTQYRWYTFAAFPENPPYPDSDVPNSTSIIVPNSQSTATFTLDKMTQPALDVLNAGTLGTLYIYANVEYDDPNTSAHYWTHACWRYVHFKSGVHSGFYNCTEYNEAR